MKRLRSFKNKVDKYIMAITFAEAGEHQFAKEILNYKQKPLRKNVRKRVRPIPRLIMHI